jgi:N-acetylmuramoyl-L-alanine amidase
LAKRADGKFYDAAGNAYPPNQVVIGAHKNGGPERPWCVYPPAQLDTVAQIASAITQTYGIKEIVGHEDVAPTRKIDPGFAFPMAAFQARILGRR